METGLFGEPSHTCIDVRANEKYITRGTPNTHSCERLQKPERDLCPNQVNYTNECEEWSTIKSNPCIQSARRTHRDITYRTRMAMIHTFVSVELLPRNFFFHFVSLVHVQCRSCGLRSAAILFVSPKFASEWVLRWCRCLEKANTKQKNNKT